MRQQYGQAQVSVTSQGEIRGVSKYDPVHYVRKNPPYTTFLKACCKKGQICIQMKSYRFVC